MVDVDGRRISILQATFDAKAREIATHQKNHSRILMYNNVIAYLEHEGAVAEPSIVEERRICNNSITEMPL